MNATNILRYVPSQVSLLAPGTLWDYYVEYLWNYQPNSWVARTAYTSRVLAILASLPIIVLALLDISSYGIARTLGVIDDVNASTSDITPVHRTPSILVHKAITPQTTASSNHEAEYLAEHTIHNLPHSEAESTVPNYLGISQPQPFYASEENNLKLSGVGVFSPAASRPPSPTNRRDLPGGRNFGKGLDEGSQLRQRVKEAPIS